MAITEAREGVIQLRYFAAGEASKRAGTVDYLRSALDEHLHARCELETVDLYEQPALMKQNRMLALPTLVRTRPAPVRKVFGDLADIRRVLAELEIGPADWRAPAASAPTQAPGKEPPRVHGCLDRQAQPADPTNTCLREIVERSRDGKAVIDRQGVLRFLNPAAERLLERTAEELLGEVVGVPLTEAETTDCRILRADGGVCVVELASTGLEWNGQMAHLVSFRDITEHAAIEAEREDLIEELQAKNAEMERFIYSVSHDLKSPLITVTGFLGMLERDLARGNLDRLPSHVARVTGATERMKHLIDDLLELSRIGRMVNMSVEVPLSQLAGEVVDILAGAIAKRGVQVRVSPELPIVRGDRTRFMELVQNLVDNAVKFTGDQPAPQIEIGCRKDGREIVCYVRDNGIGLDPRFGERIFGLFEQLHTETGGTGVGLTIAKRIVELHGGRIWVESEGPGKGCTFCFTLPTSDQQPRREKSERKR
ncbi:MAG: ATP-binding protein [Pirellulales bacterium]